MALQTQLTHFAKMLLIIWFTCCAFRTWLPWQRAAGVSAAWSWSPCPLGADLQLPARVWGQLLWALRSWFHTSGPCRRSLQCLQTLQLQRRQLWPADRRLLLSGWDHWRSEMPWRVLPRPLAATQLCEVSLSGWSVLLAGCWLSGAPLWPLSCWDHRWVSHDQFDWSLLTWSVYVL